MYAALRSLRLRRRPRRGATALEYAFLVMFVATIVNMWPRFLVEPINVVADFLQNTALPHP